MFSKAHSDITRHEGKTKMLRVSVMDAIRTVDNVLCVINCRVTT